VPLVICQSVLNDQSPRLQYGHSVGKVVITKREVEDVTCAEFLLLTKVAGDGDLLLQSM